MDSCLSIDLFGQFRLEINDELLTPLASKQMEALLALLCCHEDFRISKERLLFLFWGDKPEKKAKHSLRNLLFKTKKFFEPYQSDILESDRQNIWLSFQGQLKTDYQEMEKYSANLEDHASLEKLATILKQPFLEAMALDGSVGYSEWLFEMQETLTNKYHHVLKELIDKAKLVQDWDTLFNYCQKLQQLLPWDEDVIQQKMEALVAKQRITEAIHSYSLFVEELRNELHLDPSESLQRYADSLRQRTSSQAETKVFHSTVSSLISKNKIPRFATPYFERPKLEQEIKHQLMAPHTSCLHIHGVSGVGKTRVVCQVLQDIQSSFCDGVFFLSWSDFESQELYQSQVFYLLFAEKLKFVLDRSCPAQQQIIHFFEEQEVLFYFDEVPNDPNLGGFIQELLELLPKAKIVLTSNSPDFLDAFPSMRVPVLSTISSPGELSEAVEFLITRLKENRCWQESMLAELGLLRSIVEEKLYGHQFSIEKVAKWFEVYSAQEILQILESEEVQTEKANMIEVSLRPSWNNLFAEQRNALFSVAFFDDYFSAESISSFAGVSPFVLHSLTSSRWLLKQPRTNKYRIHSLNKQFILREMERDASFYQQQSSEFYRHFLIDWWESRTVDSIGFDPSMRLLDSLWSVIRKAFSLACEAEDISVLRGSLRMIYFYCWRIDSPEIEHFLERARVVATNQCDEEFLYELEHVYESTQMIAKSQQEKLTALVEREDELRTNANPFVQIYALRNRAVVKHFEGQHDEVVSLNRQTADVAFHHGYMQEYLSASHTVADALLLHKGSLDEAEAIYRKLVDVAQKEKNSALGARVSLGLFHSLFQRKELEKAQEVLFACHAEAQTFPNQFMLARFNLALAELKAEMGEEKEALELFRQSEIQAKSTTKLFLLPHVQMRQGVFMSLLGMKEAQPLLLSALESFFSWRSDFAEKISLALLRHYRNHKQTEEFFSALTILIARADKRKQAQLKYQSCLEWAFLLFQQEHFKQALQLIQYVFFASDYTPDTYRHDEAKEHLRQLSELLDDHYHSIQEEDFDVDAFIGSHLLTAFFSSDHCHLFQRADRES